MSIKSSANCDRIMSYQVEKKLGSGGFGDVYLLRVPNGKKYAVKVVVGDAGAEREARQLQELKHPHIVQCLCYFTSGLNLFIFLEYCPNGSVGDYIRSYGRVGERQILQWLTQMADALKYVHSNRMMHRDLKPDNILLDTAKNVKLTDFGIARDLKYTNQQVNTFAGTACYMAPEVIEHMSYNLKADIWSLGCCVHEMITGRPTFIGGGWTELIQKVTSGPIPAMPGASRELQTIVMGMLNRNTQSRLDASAVLDAASRLQPYTRGRYQDVGRITVDKEEVVRVLKEARQSSSSASDSCQIS